jgi:hypothetical protein
MRLNLKDLPKINPRKSPRIKLSICILVSLFIGIFLGWKNLPGFLKAKALFFANKDFISIMFTQNDLDELSLNINFKNWRKIQKKRAEAIKNDRLIAGSKDFVKASIIHNKQALPCEIRLKGDLSDHWNSSKWSLRVKMKDLGLLNGMSRFSIQNPVTRNNTHEWLFLETLRKEGLMSVRYDFVNVSINGKEMGIYALEEYISKEFIEFNNRREGLVVSLEEELMWSYHDNHPTNLEWNSIYRNATANTLNDNRISKSIVLGRQKTTALNLLRDLQTEELNPETLFDCEKLGKFLAICRIWPGELCLEWDDMNFYFNPVLGKLEPIGYDGTCLSASTQANEKSAFCFFTEGKVSNSWLNYALRSPRVTESYIRHLRTFSTKSYIKNLKKELFDYEQKIRKLLLRELLSSTVAEFWQNFLSLLNNDPWNLLEQRAIHIRQELDHEMPALAFVRVNNASSTYDFSLRNSLSQPVEFLGIQAKGTELNASQIIKFCPKLSEQYFLPLKTVVLPICHDNSKNNFITTEFSLPKSVIESTHGQSKTQSIIKFRILGNDKIVSLPLNFDDHPYEPDRLPFHNPKLLLNPDTFLIKDDNIYVHPGRHIIQNDIFIPSGMNLIIEPNTSLLFDKNTSIISEGVIIAKGTIEEPVILTASKDLWDGMLLFGSTDKSVFENVHFTNLGGTGAVVNPHGTVRDGWIMTGGVNVLDTKVRFDNCIFINCLTEDALNIFSSSFSLENCRFENCESDGFDGDFVNGSLKNCQFINIKGDGVDFSGSSVSVADCLFYKITDKAISVGEASNANISQILIDKANFGIVSKDDSHAFCTNISIKNAKISGIACFQKKNTFGPGHAELKNIDFDDINKRFLIQTGSSAKLDGKQIETEDFATQSLY